MKNKIELRTNFANWFAAQARAIEVKIQRATVQIVKTNDPEKKNELRHNIKIMKQEAAGLRDEESRYRLAAKVCGNECTVIG